MIISIDSRDYWLRFACFACDERFALLGMEWNGLVWSGRIWVALDCSGRTGPVQTGWMGWIWIPLLSGRFSKSPGMTVYVYMYVCDEWLYPFTVIPTLLL
jgi:hypothetical protein